MEGDLKLLNYLGIISTLDARAGGLWISYLATLNKITELEDITWFDPELGRFANKMRMKEVGGAAFSYRAYLTESTILSLSKSLEDVWIDLKTKFGVKFDIWHPTLHSEFEQEAKLVRALANVIKHNQSRINSDNSEHAKFLVQQCNLPEGIEVQYLTAGSPPLLDLQTLIYKTYLFSLDLIRQVTGYTHEILEVRENERYALVREYLVPEILKLR